MMRSSFSLSLTVLLSTLAISNQTYAESLQSVIATTLQSNPDFLAQASARRAVDNELKQSYSTYMPQVDLSLGYGIEKSDNVNTEEIVGGSLSLTRRESTVVLTQPLYSGMSTVNEVKRNRARVESSSYQVNHAAQEVAINVVKYYLEILRHKEIVQLAERTLLSHQEVYQQIKRRSDSGIGRKADLAQALGRLAFARTNLMNEEGNLRNAEANYKQVVGMLPTHLIKPQSPDALLPNSLDAAISIAEMAQPSLLSATSDVNAARAAYKAAKAPYYPAFSLELTSSHNWNLDGVTGVNNSDKAMLKMSYNLFRGGADMAQVRQNAWQVQQAAELKNRAYRATEESVRIAWNTFMTAQMQSRYFKEHRDAAVQTRDAYEKQFEIGQRTLLDLLDSENELFSAESAYVNSEYTALLGRYEVLNAMGKLLEYFNIPLPQEAVIDSGSLNNNNRPPEVIS